MQQSKLPECIYQGNDVLEILRLYEAELATGNDFQSKAHAGAIRTYRELITDKKFLTVIRKEFDSLYSILDKEIPNLRFTIEGRRKSLISFENKIVRLLNQNRSLDLIRDVFAFRIVIFGNVPPKELVKKCYSVMNNIITFYVESGYTLCEEDEVFNTMDKNNPALQELIIPQKTYIAKEYLYGVKDYIFHPKENGYQSLHCVFRTNSGFCFEVQVRTLDMDINAEEGDAEHEAYKKAKYLIRVEFDRTKVNIPGYSISKKGSIHDHIGLECPLSIFHRQKTF